MRTLLRLTAALVTWTVRLCAWLVRLARHGWAVFWPWYRVQTRRTQALVGGGAAAGVILLCVVASVGAQTPTTTQSGATGGTSSVAHTGGTAATSTVAARPTATRRPTATPAPADAAAPTDAPAPPSPTCIPGAVHCNPWGFNFTAAGGTVITDPPAGFCGVFNCIASFSSGTGYVVECANGQYSKSGGRTGACSKQGGVKATLYTH